MSLFHHNSLAFQPIDPMADGLGDDIAAERAEPDHFELYEQLDSSLADKWETIRQDPDFASSTEE